MNTQSPSHSATGAVEPSEQQICSWLIERVVKVSGLPRDDIDITAPFADFGLDSRQAVSLSGELEDWLGRELEPTLVWDYPTIELLSKFIALGEGPGSHPREA